MIKKDYYFILGVSREESPQGIRKAYRRLARKYHPDLAGEEWTSRFHEITEAYETLCDQERRAAYNLGLEHAEGLPLRRRPVYTGAAPDPEPLVPEPISPATDFLTVSDSIEALMERFARNFSRLGVPKAERPQSLTMELVLTPREAMRGGTLPIAVPTLYPCPYCRGTGSQWPFSCTYCQGKGILPDEEVLHLRIPPMVPDGSIFEITLHGLGVHNLYLRVHIRIGAM